MDPILSWGNLLEQVAIENVAGSDLGILEEPNVQDPARLIDRQLNPKR